MNGDPERLVKEYKRDEDEDEALAYGVLEIFGIQLTSADLSDDLETSSQHAPLLRDRPYSTTEWGRCVSVRFVLPLVSVFSPARMSGMRTVLSSTALLAAMGLGYGMWSIIAPGEERRREMLKNLPESNPQRMEETRLRNAMVMQVLKEAAETDQNLARGGPPGT
ncbi:hypothetical protein OJAV_G00095440 [Oryzias javanicus]|uniref:Ubiquinol-cytochrome-c reductase complex assembly factor 3 n=1 Tax=Oryzias javanicus TaxID=123683 RepID=A0A3S2PAM0_ORYJA|nr:hypothetical protein OJAV_G00095440 [Oryzias javanicus]